MKQGYYVFIILILLHQVFAQGQFMQTTTNDFNSNINFNVTITNNELKLTNDVGNGADGDLYVPPGGTTKTDGIKTAVIKNNPSGQNAIQVSSSSGFSLGDEIMIITMQDNNTDLNNNLTGQYEFKRVKNKIATALILNENLKNTYNTNGKKHQVIRVPNYNNVTIDYSGILTCDDWDGTIGGIICFRVKGSIQINALAKIDASLKGFRGGQSLISHGYDDISWGYQGEGIFGIGIKSVTNNSNAGGAGSHCASGVFDDAGSGAGGGNGSAGNDGTGGCTTIAIGGISVSTQFLTKLIIGGAGGSGANGTFYGPFGTSGKGGNGGSITFISCDSIQLLGEITSDGENGGNAVGANYALGGGGGGAGGPIYIISSKVVNNGNNFITARGGLGGTGIQAGNGGAGGDGPIRIDAPLITGTTNPPVGYNGTSYAYLGTSISPLITKPAGYLWDTLSFHTNTSAPGTSVKVDILNSADSVLFTDVSSGTNLNSFGLSTTVSSIKLRARLLNSIGNKTPILYDWSLKWAPPPPQIAIAQGALAFGSIVRGDSSIQTTYIRDNSITALTVSAITISTIVFTTNLTVPSTIAGYDSIVVKVKFSPNSYGNFVDTLYITSDGGIGKATLSGNSPFPILLMNAALIDFGNVNKTQVETRQLTLSNASINSAIIDSMVIHSKVFGFGPITLPTTIRKGDTLQVSLSFKPDSVQSYIDTLFVYNNSQIPVIKTPLIGNGTLTGVFGDNNLIPCEYKLGQNYPNPFNPSTKIKFNIPKQSQVKLIVYDILGRVVAILVNKELNAGIYEYEWDASNYPSGVYFYRLQSNEFVDIKKLVLMK